MASHPVVLPSKTFKSKKEALTFFKEMLSRYVDKEKISPTDDHLLFELIQRHPEAEDKIGVGIKSFFRVRSLEFSSSCFHLIRHDGSRTDFSYKSCVTSTSPTLEQYFYKACRNSITPRLHTDKEKIFKNELVHCFGTGEKITFEESEYRHTKPLFRELVSDFIKFENITISEDMFIKNIDMQYSTDFADLLLAEKFNTFHINNAQLEIFKK